FVWTATAAVMARPGAERTSAAGMAGWTFQLWGAATSPRTGRGPSSSRGTKPSASSRLEPAPRAACTAASYTACHEQALSVQVMRDPIAFELFKNSLLSIADEMALTIFRTAYSGVLKDVMDYSTALCDGGGQIVAQGLTLPAHLGSIPEAMASVI